jgi:hypothetical protein
MSLEEGVSLTSGVLAHPDLPGVAVTIEYVSPEQAQEWLDRSREENHNRNVRRDRAEAYAEDIVHGWWRFNGESICVDSTGLLCDGQHRCAAIVIADKPVLTIVVRGLDPEAIHTIDMGVARRYSDVLKLRGEEPKNLLVASAMERRLFQWKRRGKRMRNSSRVASADGTRLPPPTATDLLQFREQYLPLLRLALARGLDTRQKLKRVSPATFATAFFLFAEINSDAANKFFDLLISGVGFNDDRHPVLVLRDRLKDEQQLSARRTSEDEKLALICRAWNHFRDGTPVAKLYITLQGKALNDDTFPEPR